MRKFFLASAVLAPVLLITGFVILKHNHQVVRARQDVATTAYFMRQQIEMSCMLCGSIFAFGGLLGLLATRRMTGQAGQMRSSLWLVPVYVFALVSLAKLVVVLPFLQDIYGTTVRSPTQLMSLKSYHMIQAGAAICGMLASLYVFWRCMAVVRSQSDFDPICQDCGYSLRGLDGSRCPECGSVTPPGKGLAQKGADLQDQ